MALAESNCLFFFISFVVSVALTASENSALNNILPSKVSLSNTDILLTGLAAYESDESSQCKICNIIAGDWIQSPCERNRNCTTETAKLIKFHCLKANSTDIFMLNLNDPEADILGLFNRSLPFSFLIHGYIDFYPGLYPFKGKGWMTRTIMDWANIGVNVCAVNWGALSNDKKHNYFVASQINTGRVADYLAEVLLRFETAGMKLLATTLAGHSLGGQIAGKTGALIRNRGKLLGRIYGLDPAGPCFTFPCLVDEALRLDENDAKHVQCIHTNMGLLGQVPRCGCQDFYINLGIVEMGTFQIVKDHYLACIIFHWTLNNNNKCKSIVDDQLIGIHSQNKCGIYQMITNKTEPFCSV